MESLTKKVNFQLLQKQVDFIGTTEQFAAYVGGIGTGKTTALILKALMHSRETPNNYGVIVRKNYIDLLNSTIKDFEEYSGFTVNRQTGVCKLPNKSELLFTHADVLGNLRNLNAGFYALEQAEEFGDSSVWDFLQMRLRRNVKFRTGFLIANANGHNWIYDKFIKDGAPKNHKCVQATTYDFASILPADYITNLEQNLPKKLFRRFVMNSHEEAEGLVYDEFNEAHVEEAFEIPETWERGFSIDHGYRNPTAVIWYAIDHDGIVHIYKEHYEREQTISYHAEKIKATDDVTTGYSDPSMHAKTQQRGNHVYSYADEYSEFGITLIPASKSLEDASIARVNEFFKAGNIKIFNTCVNTLHEVRNWKWAPQKASQAGMNIKEVPEDRDNHACDALKYMIVTRFSAPKRAKRQILERTPAWYLAERAKKNTNRYNSGGEGRYKH